MSLHSTALASADHAHLLTLAHERSLRYGLALRDAPDYQRLASGALRDALDQHRFLCQHATPVMEHLFSQINNTASIMVLTLNRPGFPRRLGASGSDAAQTRQAAGRQHWNDDVWGYRTFRCS